MGWASGHVTRLQAGQTVSFRPRGNSMAGRVESGQVCTVAPLTEAPKVGDVVLCRVGRAEYLHLVKAVQGPRYLIGNNKGGTNGWVGRESIFGVLVKVAP